MVVTVATVKVAGLAVVPVAVRDNGSGSEGSREE